MRCILEGVPCWSPPSVDQLPPVPSSGFLGYRSSAALGCATRHSVHGRKGPDSAAEYRYMEVQSHKEDWSEPRRTDVASQFSALAWRTALHRQGARFDCLGQSADEHALGVLDRPSRGLMIKRVERRGRSPGGEPNALF